MKIEALSFEGESPDTSVLSENAHGLLHAPGSTTTERGLANAVMALCDVIEAFEAKVKDLHMNRDFMEALAEYGETYRTRDAETELDVLAALDRALA